MGLDRNLQRPVRLTLKRQSASYYIDGILKQDRVILSQAITLIESTRKEDYQLAQEVIEGCLPHTGNSTRIGITGVPGVGKSTFIEAFGKELTSQGNKEAVLAIDPTSQSSRGSILGDKTRMNELATDANAFIRPSASGNTLGGVAQKTQESLLLCEAAGYNYIIIETVGVGQSETEVKNLTDFFLLLMIAGAGDELQGIKRGIMEMADAILINKAEGDILPLAKQAQRAYKNAIHLFPPKDSDWIVPVELCSALNKTGIKEVISIIESYKNKTTINGYFEENRNKQQIHWFTKKLNELILQDFYNESNNQDRIEKLKQAILSKQISPFDAANKAIDR